MFSIILITLPFTYLSVIVLYTDTLWLSLLLNFFNGFLVCKALLKMFWNVLLYKNYIYSYLKCVYN